MGEIVGGFPDADLPGILRFRRRKWLGEPGGGVCSGYSQTALRNVESHARILGLHNIVPVWTNLERYGAAKIADHRIDVGLLISILFQTQQHEAIMRETDRMMKIRGVLLLWIGRSRMFLGPPVR